MSNSAAGTNIANLDNKLREAVRDIMAAENVKENDFAKVQEILDQKAALVRAPFSEKVRRIKESA